MFGNLFSARRLKWRGPLESRAAQILRGKNFISGKQSSGVWRRNAPSVGKVVLRYGEETLINCASQNRDRAANWFLVWIFGLSLRKQREFTEGHQFPIICFDSGSDEDPVDRNWWIRESENYWADRDYGDNGYWLMDFSGKFSGMNWNDQEQKIRRSGELRAPELLVAEAAISILQVHQMSVILDWFHFGPTIDSQGRRIRIGEFNGRGMVIVGEPKNVDDVMLRVVTLYPRDF
ncbi:MAG: hypothetical protein NUV53_04090 [Patescibacteria group bacterium]|nr:hypothetical protein [Patescibacteria group bacterium]